MSRGVEPASALTSWLVVETCSAPLGSAYEDGAVGASTVTSPVGAVVGARVVVGAAVGASVGARVGAAVGAGVTVGLTVGAAVAVATLTTANDADATKTVSAVFPFPLAAVVTTAPTTCEPRIAFVGTVNVARIVPDPLVRLVGMPVVFPSQVSCTVPRPRFEPDTFTLADTRPEPGETVNAGLFAAATASDIARVPNTVIAAMHMEKAAATTRSGLREELARGSD
jgi:hypothetical protein